MKRIVALAVIAVVALPVFAWGQEAYMELLRQDIRTKKTEVLTMALALSDEEAGKFWPIHRQYETELAAIGDRRLANIKNYAEHYDTLNNAQADAILAAAFKIQKDRSALMEKYYKQIKKVLPATTAARWVQVEWFINDIIDVRIAAELPLVETVRDAVAEPKGSMGHKK